PSGGPVVPPTIKVNPGYNPFNADKPAAPAPNQGWLDRKAATDAWKELMSIEPPAQQPFEAPAEALPLSDQHVSTVGQFFGKYILCKWGHGMMLLDQHRAHKRILFEKLLADMEGGKCASQQMLFPEVIELSASDASLLTDITGDLQKAGIELSAIGPRSFQVTGIPLEASGQAAAHLVEEFLEQYKNQSATLKFSPRERLAWSLARTMAIPYQRALNPKEQQELAQQWAQCHMPHYAESSQRTFINFSLEEIQGLFS
ncbi:MAG: hypothetical protein JNM00_13720, partial [Flavobacteriales bacterium]|nr:hypothetical protein [Flavobacteriales bacterium]